MTTTPTPRTDSVLSGTFMDIHKITTLSRQLERDLAASRELTRQFREVAELMRDSQILKGNNPAAKMAMWFDALAKLEALNQSVKTDAEI